MNQYKLVEKGWIFRFDNATSRLGATRHDQKKISLSRHMASVATEEQVTQVLLHEIAHALLPYDVGHGKQWKELAAKIGYTGGRTAYNPYQHPKKKASSRPKRQPAPMKPEASGVAVGDRLRLPNGELVVVLKAARTRFHARSEATGRMWGVPFTSAAAFKVKDAT